MILTNNSKQNFHNFQEKFKNQERKDNKPLISSDNKN